MTVQHLTKNKSVFRVDDKDTFAFIILFGKIELFSEEPKP